MVCTECGFDDPDEGIYCSACGAKILSDTVAPSESALSRESTTESPSNSNADESIAIDSNHLDSTESFSCDNCGTVTTWKRLYKMNGFRVCPDCGLDALGRPDFCPECTADVESTEVFAEGLDWDCLGKTERCIKCNSLVRTRWYILIFFPLIPLGSYRYREGVVEDANGEFQEIHQRGRTRMRWGQALSTVLVFYISIVVLLVLIYAVSQQ